MMNAVRILKILALPGLLLLLLLGGCTGASEVETPESVVTPEPVVISIGMAAQPEAGTAPPAAPTIEPTPSPAPTEDPQAFARLAPTINMSYEELVGSTDDMKKKPKELLKDGYPAPKTYYIIVDKHWQVTMIYKRLDDGTAMGAPDYDNPVRYMLCSTGNPNKPYGYETMSGKWDIEAPKARFHQFVNLEAAQYLTLIHSLTYFHSILYEKNYDLSTLIKETYDALGNRDSHSCIRLTVPDARWMFYNIAPGTTCEIRDGSADDVKTQAIRAKLILPPSKSGVRLRASDYKWTDNWQIKDVAHEVPYKDMALPKPDDDSAAEIGITPAPDAAGDTTQSTPTDAGAVTAPPTDAAGTPAADTPAPAADTPAPAADTPTPRNDDIGEVTF